MSDDKSPTAIDLLEQVCNIMENRELAEVFLRDGNVTLKVRREGPPVPVAIQSTPRYTETATAHGQTTASPPAQLPEEVGELIQSTMPGTFYRAPSPDEPSYIETGDAVAEEDVLCLIEAMKVFNEFTAPFPCEILDILVENGSSIEYGQPLFRIKRL